MRNKSANAWRPASPFSPFIWESNFGSDILKHKSVQIAGVESFLVKTVVQSSKGLVLTSQDVRIDAFLRVNSSCNTDFPFAPRIRFCCSFWLLAILHLASFQRPVFRVK
jgi:hypothetical protein